MSLAPPPNSPAPTNEVGRWDAGADGRWYENPGYTKSKQAIDPGIQHQTVNGMEGYGKQYTAAQGNADEAQKYNATTWKAKSEGGYEDQLTNKVLGAYASISGNPAIRSALANPAVTAQFRRQPSESYDDWMGRLSAALPGFGYQTTTGEIAQRNSPLDKDQDAQSYIKFASAKNAGGLTPIEQEQADETAKVGKTKQAIQDFINEMNAPLDANHPEVQKLMNIVGDKASTDARLRGINGPLAVANTTQQSANALGQYNTERRGLAAGLLQNQEATNYRDQQTKKEDLQRNFANQYQGWNDTTGLGEANKNNHGAGMAAGGALGAGIGTSAGTAIGAGIGSMFPGVGTALGGAVGGGLGGLIGRGVGAGIGSSQGGTTLHETGYTGLG